MKAFFPLEQVIAIAEAAIAYAHSQTDPPQAALMWRFEHACLLTCQPADPDRACPEVWEAGTHRQRDMFAGMALPQGTSHQHLNPHTYELLPLQGDDRLLACLRQARQAGDQFLCLHIGEQNLRWTVTADLTAHPTGWLGERERQPHHPTVIALQQARFGIRNGPIGSDVWQAHSLSMIITVSTHEIVFMGLTGTGTFRAVFDHDCPPGIVVAAASAIRALTEMPS